jgi:hypothetical protein
MPEHKEGKWSDHIINADDLLGKVVRRSEAQC